MEVTVYVWSLRSDNPGHVSLQVGTTYMSYWPAEAAGKKDFKVGRSHDPGFPSSYEVDRRMERRGFDTRVDLGGLDTPRMIDAWDALKQDQVRYNMLRHNCSTVVASLLEIGSEVRPHFLPQVRIDDHVTNMAARMFLRVRFLGSHITMWTPDTVLRYAQEIKRVMPH